MSRHGDFTPPDDPEHRARYLWITPVDSNGEELIGAVVNGSKVFSGSYVEERLPGSFGHGDSTSVEIKHFGRTVLDREVSYEEVNLNESESSSSSVVYTFRPECASFYPQQFNGLKNAEWLGDVLALVWDPPRERTDPGAEVSLATSEENLFADGETTNLGGKTVTAATDSSGETVAYTFESDGTSLQVSNRGFMDSSFVAAARLQGGTRGESQVVEVSGYNVSSLPTGPDVTSVSTAPSTTTIVGGDSLIVNTSVTGSGSPNPRVSFSTSGGAEVALSSETKALVTADADGTVTATSEEDSTITGSLSITTEPFPDQIGRPSAPANPQVKTFGPEGEVLLEWDAPEADIGTRAEFVGPVTPTIQDTLKGQMVVRGVTRDVQASLKHIGPDGRVSNSSTSITISESAASGNADRPTALRVDSFPEVVVSPADSHSVDLSTSVKIAGESGAQSDRWDNAEVDVTVLGSGMSASASGSVVTITAPADADPNSESRDLVIVRMKNGDRDPSHLTIPVARGSSSGTNPTKCIAGLPAGWAGLAEEVDATKLVGSGPEVYSDSSWSPKFGQQASAPDAEISSETLSLSYDPQANAEPVVLALKGDDGAATITFTDDAPPHYAAKNLPTGQIDKVERNGNWISFASGLLEPGANPSQWKRVLQGNALYDVSLFEPPQELHYAAPAYFEDTWIDEHKYPEDATLDFDKGAAVYRSGLESPSASETVPSVDQLSVQPVVGGLDVRWSVSADGTSLTGAVEVNVTPDGESSFTTSGSGSAQLRGLDKKPHTIEVLSASKTATPRREEKQVTITAWRAADLSYTYRYESGASPDTFVDGFGTDHSSFPVEVSASEAADSQELKLLWGGGDSAGGETQRLTADVQWRAPSEPVETDREVQTGSVLPAGEVPIPTFKSVQYEGSRTVSLASNVYPPGNLRVEPEGYLPSGISGELEDHITLTLVLPDGEEVGPETTLKTHTEVRVRATVEPEGGQSPFFYGARAIHRQAS